MVLIDLVSVDTVSVDLVSVDLVSVDTVFKGDDVFKDDDIIVTPLGSATAYSVIQWLLYRPFLQTVLIMRSLTGLAA